MNLRRLKIFFFNGIILTLTSFIMRSIGVSFNVYISNRIGAESVGVFQLILSIYLFAITLATSGINLAATRIVSEELALSKDCVPKIAIKKCISYSFFLGSLSCLLLCLFAPFLATTILHNKVPHYLLYFLAISLPFISVSSALNGYFTALRKITKNAGAKFFEQFIKITVTTYFLCSFFANTLEYACLSLILGEMISEIFSCIFCYFLYVIDIKKCCCTNYSSKRNYTKKILTISIPVAITSYIRSGLSSLKQLIIPLRLEKSGISCEQAISQYGMVTGMAMPILMFPEVLLNSFSTLLVPEFSAYYACHQTKQINYAISKIFKLTLLFSIGIIGIFLFYSDNLSMLIYHNLEVAKYLKILCPLILFMYFDSIVDSILKGLNKQLSVMSCNILDLFVSILCIYFIVPIYGIYGYLFVIFVSELLNCGISIVQLWQLTKFKLNWKNWIILPIFCVILSFFIVNLLPFSFSSLFLETIFYITVFIGNYLFLLYLAKARCSHTS